MPVEPHPLAVDFLRMTERAGFVEQIACGAIIHAPQRRAEQPDIGNAVARWRPDGIRSDLDCRLADIGGQVETAIGDGEPRPAVQIGGGETKAGRAAAGEIHRRRQRDVEIVEFCRVAKARRVTRREQLEQRVRVRVGEQTDSKIERRMLQRRERLDYCAAAGVDADVSAQSGGAELTACTSSASSSRLARPTFQGPQIRVI